MALWSGRFAKKMTAKFSEMNKSLPVDIRLLPYEIKQNAAYAKRLADVGVIDKKELRNIETGLRQILSEYENGEYFPLPDEEDVHSLVEHRLTEIIGDAGKKIHTGRSRNEEIATEIKMFLLDNIGLLKTNIRSLIKAILGAADSNKEIIMPGFTHMQHAQPVLFAHYLCSFAYTLKDDEERLERILQGSLATCPMGSGAIGGSAFPIDREKLASDLGFKTPTANSIQAVSQRDETLETASALALLMIHLSRYAEDFIIWSSQEFGYIELDESVSTGSSMMPQKKNPDSLELIRGKSARVIGNMQSLFTLLKGTPLTYSRDLQEDKKPIFDIIDETNLCLTVFKEIIETLKINGEKMSSSLNSLIQATDMADDLTKKGLPFREAHGIIGKLVRDALTTGRRLHELTLQELKKASPLFDESSLDTLSKESSIKAREILGGTGKKSVERQIKELSAWL
ncbi:MAG: argininosuccinate lyase [Deltaproteobacteria bacterium]|nr:argininosuccinate lyase [Deltaproteobacteria bacterium]